MLNWIKFFPLVWKVNNNISEIGGPYFPKLRPNKWRFDDCTLYFRAPYSNPVLGFSGDGIKVGKILPGSKNILKASWERAHYGGVKGAPRNLWKLEQFYFNDWFFVGAWFTGLSANLRMLGLLISPESDSSFFDKNLFHPKVFEAAVANYLDQRYGFYRRSGSIKSKYKGPLNWSVMSISPSIQAIVCDVYEVGNGSVDNPLLHRSIFMPVTNRHFIRINFDFGGVEIYRDEVRSKPLFKLCDSIINSFKLEVGPETQAEWDKVAATCPDMSITETMNEFPWPLKIEKPNKKSTELDITPSQDALGQD